MFKEKRMKIKSTIKPNKKKKYSGIVGLAVSVYYRHPNFMFIWQEFLICRTKSKSKKNNNNNKN